MRKLLVLLLVMLLASCSWPFGKKTAKTQDQTAKGQLVAQKKEPKPGDVRLVDGIEYIYARNRQYQLTPYEPEYQWVRKDEYDPGLFTSVAERITGASANKKEQAQMEQRMAKLEQSLKERNARPQAAPAIQTASLPAQSAFSLSAPPAVTFSYPSPSMKRRVLVLPLSDKTNYKDEHLEELTTKRLVARLENTGTIITVDPHALPLPADIFKPDVMKSLYDLYGIEAVVKGSLSDVYTSTSRVEGKDGKTVSFALSKISLDVYNTETGKLLRELTARNPFFLSRENGEMSSERARVRAIDLAIELVADDLLKSLLNLDWHTRIASIQGEKIFLNAGRQSGLKEGDILEVYAPGTQVVDQATNLALGRTRGKYKGEIEVEGVFGVDASWAKVSKGSAFAPTDLVYLRQR